MMTHGYKIIELNQNPKNAGQSLDLERGINQQDHKDGIVRFVLQYEPNENTQAQKDNRTVHECSGGYNFIVKSYLCRRALCVPPSSARTCARPAASAA